jgi:pyruvate formate lyase activating enzyme
LLRKESNDQKEYFKKPPILRGFLKYKIFMKECLLYKKLDKNFVQCLACNHSCIIGQSQAGKCGVRENRGGVLYSSVYGRVAAVNVDPIEKKPLYHFLPGTWSYSLGTHGCNFQCLNCQNYSISQTKNMQDIGGQGYSLSPEKAVEQALSFNCQSISYTYNEPTVFWEYALDIMKLARAQGLKNVWVSNGFMTEAVIKHISPYLDASNIDIKSREDEFYRNFCGASLSPVLDNCKLLKKEGVWLEVTTLIIPTLTDKKDMLRNLARFIATELGKDTPWHISAFSGDLSWKLKHLPDTKREILKEAKNIGEEEGLKAVYIGNI